MFPVRIGEEFRVFCMLVESTFHNLIYIMTKYTVGLKKDKKQSMFVVNL